MENAVLILVVEDEPLVRELVQGDLEDGGYKVVEAGSGEEAVTVLDEQTAARGLVTDITLGGKNDLTGWMWHAMPGS